MNGKSNDETLRLHFIRGMVKASNPIKNFYPNRIRGKCFINNSVGKIHSSVYRALETFFSLV